MSYLLNLPNPEPPRFPDKITVAAPIGLRTRLRQAAEAERTTSADLIRQAIEARVTAILKPPGNLRRRGLTVSFLDSLLGLNSNAQQNAATS
ncbi:hypothetical protein [Lichenihabitans psoromatis]|uniref:hypothetical protein n=1 Tax=Lichenihabitans psoromatis TaxID=2528642 RepID=UPI0010355BB2|nr:hypothetical protein [Lichenihabitans psoromatis]